ncbi:glycosyltransferase [Bacillus paranthracis]|uniref:glycosyltransferase n=1 Tax=Bacillus paranthracis TaxID=2026186 RepID=UPI0002B8E042|nr:glycosyltransferase [Bacillus paranthracis]
MSKIRVLHVLSAMDLGGIESFIMAVFRELDKSRIQFDFAINVEHKTYFHDEIIKLGGRIFIHPHPKEGLVKYNSALQETLKQQGPYDVVHVHSYLFNGNVLEIAAKQGIPIRISHSHTVRDRRKSNFKRKIYRYLMRKKIDKYATHLLGCSKLACETLYTKKNFEDQRIAVIKNGINLSVFQNNDKDFLKQHLNLQDDTKIIGHIGRFAEVKNHKLVIKAFNSMLLNDKKNSSHYHLVLVGDGEELVNIQEMVREYKIQDKVSFLGKRDDIAKIMAGLDLLIFPSFHEGLGIVLVEAQASNVPCLISNGVAKDAIIVDSLIDVEDLSKDEEVWGKRALEILERPKNDSRFTIDLVRQNGYDIRSVTQTLEKMYHNEE